MSLRLSNIQDRSPILRIRLRSIHYLRSWLNTYTRLRDKVKGNLSMLFAGHDKDMLEKYPKVAEDVTQLI